VPKEDSVGLIQNRQRSKPNSQQCPFVRKEGPTQLNPAELLKALAILRSVRRADGMAPALTCVQDAVTVIGTAICNRTGV
jgi:hypothetical protein